MSLYPSLEDMQVSKMMQVQSELLSNSNQITASEQSLNSSGRLETPLQQQLYPDMQNFLGMELTENMIRENMPHYAQNTQLIANSAVQSGNALMSTNNVIAPLSGNSTISQRANVTHGIRELILCKGADGKVGLRVQAVNNGIFIAIVVKDSPAALAGLRFGDQILQLNGQLLAGYSVDKVHKLLKNSPKNNISMVIRDRPFERTVTLFKDSHGDLGFQYENGKIVSIVKDSSAARNGLLTDHNLLEVNGQTVVALKDKDIKKIIEGADRVVKITIIPSFIYDHMVKKLGTSFLRGIMDHSIPDI